MSELKLIVTQGPYSSFLDEVAAIDEVSGIRLNTIMPIKEGKLQAKLTELKGRLKSKDLWIDLKSRQLRIKEFANTPYTAVTISHKISVNLPNTVFFDNGSITGRLVEIDGNKLILEDYVGRLLGPGESVNIIDDSLEYLEPSFLTDLDREYIAIGREIGLRHFMLSFVHGASDIDELKKLSPGAVVMSKLESKKGLSNLAEITAASDYVVAARGDLYVELDYPHQIADALKAVIKVAGGKAVVASRMLASLLKQPLPACPEIMDIQYLKDLGYEHFLIGDDICFKREVLMRAINIFKAIFKS